MLSEIFMQDGKIIQVCVSLPSTQIMEVNLLMMHLLLICRQLGLSTSSLHHILINKMEGLNVLFR
jgi:hypothetical protein